MSPFELSSCCSCHVFSYYFAQFFLLKRVKCPPCFVFTTKTTQPRPQVFSVNDALTCRRLHFDVISSLNTKFFQIWSSVTGYACAFSQSELGKYFDGIIKRIMQISEGVIHLGLRRRWITPSSICIFFISYAASFINCLILTSPSANNC